MAAVSTSLGGCKHKVLVLLQFFDRDGIRLEQNVIPRMQKKAWYRYSMELTFDRDLAIVVEAVFISEHGSHYILMDILHVNFLLSVQDLVVAFNLLGS